MTISMIGIDHDRAPVDIRALFAFTDENKKELMMRICTQEGIRECVLLSTCNRTELYTVSEEKISVRSVMTAMQRILLDMAGIGDAIRFWGRSKRLIRQPWRKVSAALGATVFSGWQ